MLVIIAAFDHAWWAGAIAVTAIVLAAIYALWMYQRAMTGPGAVDLVDAHTDAQPVTVGAAGGTGSGSHPAVPGVGTGSRSAVPTTSMRDLDAREVGTLAPLLLALVLLGFFPMPLLDVINPHVADLMSDVGVSDAEPQVSGSHSSQGDTDE